MPLSAQEIARRRKTVDVPGIEEMGGVATLRALSAGDVVRSQYEYTKAEKEGRDPAEGNFRDLALSLIGPDGALLYPLDEKDEPTEGIAAVKALSDTSYVKLVRALFALNGTSATAAENTGKN